MSRTGTIQSGARQVSDNFKTAKIFKGVQRTDGAYGRDFDQFVTGYGMFVWLQMPKFCTHDKSKIKDIVPAFQRITEFGGKSFNGIDDDVLDTIDIDGGIAGNKIVIPGNAKNTFEEFTIKVYEYLGSPVREVLDYWVNGIRDKSTGYAHYNGLAGTTDGLPYANENHTGIAMYILTDPTGRAAGLEYACLLSNIFPKKVPKQHLNMESGEHNVAEIDVTFAAHKDEGPDINTYAKTILEAAQSWNTMNYYEEKFGTPFSDNKARADAAANKSKVGL